MSPLPSRAGLAFGVLSSARLVALVALGVPWHSSGAFPGIEGVQGAQSP